jgi:hypothetical protein
VNLEVLYPTIPTDEQRALEDHLHRGVNGRSGVLHHYPSVSHPCLLCFGLGEIFNRHAVPSSRHINRGLDNA